ncbi:YfhJ family protein [Bacillus sp. FJAT-50079]|uniref:YfhJ family protein n=1 Tax=Bacillus sp. FJAT-50079 TaxID=2833577 RepID=UPI001BC9BD8C|nr:YfhJ family protein [Bacillus sp. FJAT-50079]MBS4209128.1 YfhJ family protein [Bacillus sp. FJAT-50079]
MNDYHEQLANYLLSKNSHLSAARARTWVELLWEDFETTYAKAGRKYRGHEMAHKVVRSWIDHYGSRLHEFAAINPKYAHMLNDDHDLMH